MSKSISIRCVKVSKTNVNKSTKNTIDNIDRIIDKETKKTIDIKRTKKQVTNKKTGLTITSKKQL